MSWVSSKTSFDTSEILRSFLVKKGYQCNAWSRKDSTDHTHRAVYIYPEALAISLDYLNKLNELFKAVLVTVHSEIERIHDHEASIMYIKLIISEEQFEKIINEAEKK